MHITAVQCSHCGDTVSPLHRKPQTFVFIGRAFTAENRGGNQNDDNKWVVAAAAAAEQ